jgi:hypothetical protein
MFLIQHGYQKGSKIHDAIAATTAHGVIWSPGDERPEALAAAMYDPALSGVAQAVDPQVYVSGLASASLKRLPDYRYFRANLQPRHFTASRVVQMAAEILDWEASLPTSVILAPSVAIDSATGRWAQVATLLTEASVSNWRARNDGRSIYATVAIRDSVLANEIEVNALLNEITAWDCDGFYLLFEIAPNLDPTKQDDLLERALWITYSLGDLNEFPVWVGYAGLAGYAFRVAGASAFAAGWWQKLQYWSPDHWLDGGGGRQPRPRVVLDSLLGSILIEIELAAIRRADAQLYADLVGGTGPLANALRQSNPTTVAGATDRDQQAAQLFAVCAELDSRCSGTFGQRGRQLLDDIAETLDLHRRIRQTGLQLEVGSGPRRVNVWQNALQGLATRLGVSL